MLEEAMTASRRMFEKRVELQRRQRRCPQLCRCGDGCCGLKRTEVSFDLKRARNWQSAAHQDWSSEDNVFTLTALEEGRVAVPFFW